MEETRHLVSTICIDWIGVAVCAEFRMNSKISLTWSKSNFSSLRLPMSYMSYMIIHVKAPHQTLGRKDQEWTCLAASGAAKATNTLWSIYIIYIYQKVQWNLVLEYWDHRAGFHLSKVPRCLANHKGRSTTRPSSMDDMRWSSHDKSTRLPSVQTSFRNKKPITLVGPKGVVKRKWYDGQNRAPTIRWNTGIHPRDIYCMSRCRILSLQ